MRSGIPPPFVIGWSTKTAEGSGRDGIHGKFLSADGTPPSQGDTAPLKASPILRYITPSDIRRSAFAHWLAADAAERYLFHNLAPNRTVAYRPDLPINGRINERPVSGRPLAPSMSENRPRPAEELEQQATKLGCSRSKTFHSETSGLTNILSSPPPHPAPVMANNPGSRYRLQNASRDGISRCAKAHRPAVASEGAPVAGHTTSSRLRVIRHSPSMRRYSSS